MKSVIPIIRISIVSGGLPCEHILCPFLIIKALGWMTRDFTSFSTIFQSYQDDERMIMKGCVQWNPFTVEKISP